MPSAASATPKPPHPSPTLMKTSQPPYTVSSRPKKTCAQTALTQGNPIQPGVCPEKSIRFVPHPPDNMISEPTASWHVLCTISPLYI
ncbi:hypothetical protein L195_g041843 [Trifolium pratense]|uniref:Uncharacterized protein n=1 Tax=Trifolium pratense TaxID=57577 RepID=A0A2K3M4R3_TRIPR|nr:hypothetical protein L195_g041843 [Trifolium pratense]